MIPRELTSLLLQCSKEFPSITLTGPRQSGKTTLLRTTFPQATYVHLEEPDILEFARQDPRGFIQSYPRPVIFDEIQYAPNLLPYLKAEIDNHRRKPGQFFLTGSQSFALLPTMTESLAGRTAYLHLHPLTSLEVLKELRLTPIEKTIFRGFYPELYSVPHFSKVSSFTRWQGGYIRTFIERDVRRISNVGNLDQFERFVRLMAGRSGQLLNLSEVGRDAGIDQTTAKRWVSILQSGFVVFTLLPYHKNFSKRLVKSPKMYFYDVGLCRYLLGIRELDQLRLNQSFGSLFETLVLADIKKQVEHQSDSVELAFYRSSDGIEVDLLLSVGKKTFAFEIKASATPRLDQVSSLKKWMKLSQTKMATVLCLVDKEIPLGGGIRAIPWWDHKKIWG